MVAMTVNLVLLFLVNVAPGWQAVPFLTESTTDVLLLVNLSMAAAVAANAVYSVFDPPWVRSTRRRGDYVGGTRFTGPDLAGVPVRLRHHGAVGPGRALGDRGWHLRCGRDHRGARAVARALRMGRTARTGPLETAPPTRCKGAHRSGWPTASTYCVMGSAGMSGTVDRAGPGARDRWRSATGPASMRPCTAGRVISPPPRLGAQVAARSEKWNASHAPPSGCLRVLGLGLAFAGEVVMDHSPVSPLFWRQSSVALRGSLWPRHWSSTGTTWSRRC